MAQGKMPTFRQSCKSKMGQAVMEGKILHEVKGMSGEQKARIRSHPNGRQPGHIPEQSTVADQKQGE